MINAKYGGDSPLNATRAPRGQFSDRGGGKEAARSVSLLVVAMLVIGGSALGGALATTQPNVFLLGFLPFVAVGALVVAYRAPGAIFAAYLAIPFYKGGLQPYLPVDITLVLALLNMLQLLFLIRSLRRSPFSPPMRRRVLIALALWTAFSAPILFSVAYAVDTASALAKAANWLFLVFLPCLAAIRIASDRRFVAQFLWGILVIGAAVTVTGMWLLPSVGAWPNDRLRVFGNDTIRVGQAALLVPIVTAFYVVSTANRVIRLISLGLIPFAVLVSAASGSRGPFLMLALSGILLAVRFSTTRFRRPRPEPVVVYPLRLIAPVLIGLLMFFVLPISSILSYVPSTSITRLESLSTIVGGFANQDHSKEAPDPSTAGRLIAYQFAEGMFSRKPVLGYGTGSFAWLVSHDEPRLTWPQANAHPHNLILQTAAEYGVVGLMLLTLLLGGAFLRGVRLARDPAWNTIAVLLLFFLLCSMVSTEMLDNRMLWGLVLLTLMAPDPAPLAADMHREHGRFNELDSPSTRTDLADDGPQEESRPQQEPG